MSFTPEKVTRYFYSTDTPYRWSSGARIHRMNKTGEYIASLEEAEQLALAAQEGFPGQENYVAVTWGSMVELNFKYDRTN